MSNSPYNTSALIDKFFPFIRAYIPKYLAAMGLLVITIVLSLLPPLFVKLMIDRAIQQKNVTTLNLLGAVLVAAIIVMGIARAVTDYIHEWVSAWFISDLRGNLFNHIQNQSLTFFSDVKVGEMIGRLRVDVIAVYSVLVNTFIAALSEIIQIVAISVFLFYLNVKLAILALLFTGPLCWILKSTAGRLKDMSLAVRDKDVALLELFQEVLSNIQIVKLFRREQYASEKYFALSTEAIETNLSRLRYKFAILFVIGGLTGVASVVVLWAGAYQVLFGGLSFGSLFAFYLYTVRLYTPIQSLASRGIEISNGMASAQRIAEYLDINSALKESRDARKLLTVHGDIVFEDVTFRYPSNPTPALHDINLEIRAGDKVAVVGPSGAGKTTFINLLCRLYDVSSGSISVDGHNIREVTLGSLYANIGVVSQDTYLFNTTIEENIRFGKPEASLEEVVLAAKAAHLHNFIQDLPGQYKTIVGSRGMKLSGGQRQRLALARMMLKNANIWILDEFTSALDSQSEVLVYENLAPLLEVKTTIIIAHRLSTVLLADYIVVLDRGRIVETGTHSFLYEKNGFYRELFDTQLRPPHHPINDLLPGVSA